MAGRKRLPTRLHIVRGTAQPCRINRDEPKAPNEPPRPAIQLSSRASFWFGVIVGRIADMGISSVADSESVMLLALRLAEVEECDQEIKENGRVYAKFELVELPSGETRAQKILKANPAVAQRSEAMRHAQSLLAEFGLSPANRAKIPARDAQKAENPWEKLING